MKEVYTKVFLSEANLPSDDEAIKAYMTRWWKNTRKKLNQSLALTPEGFDFLVNTLQLKEYRIEFPKDFKFTSQILIWLDQFIDCPHYYTKKEIYVFKERKAAELMLFSGDVRRYGLSKALARQRDSNC
jgi:hypothetical protein